MTIVNATHKPTAHTHYLTWCMCDTVQCFMVNMQAKLKHLTTSCTDKLAEKEKVLSAAMVCHHHILMRHGMHLSLPSILCSSINMHACPSYQKMYAQLCLKISQVEVLCKEVCACG